MSTWDDRLKQHPVHVELIQLENLLESIKITTDLDNHFLESWLRIKHFASYSRNQLDSVDAFLVQTDNLDNITKLFKKINAELNKYKVDKSTLHISEISNIIDHEAYHLWGMPLIATVTATRSIRDTVSSTIRYTKHELEALKNEFSSLNTLVLKTTNEIELQKSRVDSAISEFQAQFSLAQESRQRNFSNEQLEIFNAFKKESEKRINDFTTKIDAFQQNYDNFIDSASNTIKRSMDEFTISALNNLESIEHAKENAVKIVGAIGAKVLSVGYIAAAETDRKTAESWEKFAKFTFYAWIIIVAGFAFATFVRNTDITWSMTLSKLLISTPFILFAGFSAIQVSIHRRSERINRRSGLEMDTIDPFLSTLDKDSQREIKKMLVDKFFGQREQEVVKHDSKSDPTIIDDIAKFFHGLIQKGK